MIYLPWNTLYGWTVMVPVQLISSRRSMVSTYTGTIPLCSSGNKLLPLEWEENQTATLNKRNHRGMVTGTSIYPPSNSISKLTSAITSHGTHWGTGQHEPHWVGKIECTTIGDIKDGTTNQTSIIIAVAWELSMSIFQFNYGYWCSHTNVTQDVSKQLHHMKGVAKGSRELRESREVEWLNKLFAWIRIFV